MMGRRGGRSWPWLIWLLPYLLFTVANGGIHNHSLLSSGPTGVSSGSVTSSLHGFLPGKAQPSDCPACQWLANSSVCGFAHGETQAALPACLVALGGEISAASAVVTTHLSRAPPLA